MRSLKVIVLALCACFPLTGQTSSDAVQHFRANLTHYLSVTHDAREHIQPSSSLREIHARRAAVADRIRRSRTGAKQGEVFTPDVSALFINRFIVTLSGPEGKRIRASLRHAEPVASADLTIDGKYPASVPLQSTPPSLLLNLPPLPKGLEYRIVGRTLVLRDADTDTVADYLPDALPPAPEVAH